MNNAQLQTAPVATSHAPHGDVEHFTPKEGVCTKEINFALDGDNIDYVDFCGGCEGNLKAIASMIEGMHVDFILDHFSGITCGSKTTSCVDQLCQALVEYKEKNQSK